MKKESLTIQKIQPTSGHTTLNQDWDDRTIWIVGGGPSLLGFDFNLLKNEFTIGVNRSCFAANTKACFSLDKSWIGGNIEKLNKDYAGEIYLASPVNVIEKLQPKCPRAKFINRIRHTGLSLRTDYITGTNSGFGALNLSVLKGAKKIILLGFDMKLGKDRTHWHEGYVRKEAKRELCYLRWKHDFETASSQCRDLGIMVINGNPDSEIHGFDKQPLEKIIKNELSKSRK